MSPRSPSRRAFLRSSATLLGSSLAIPCWFARRTARAESAAPTDRLQIGAIGVGGRGMDIAQQAARHGEVVAVCDVDRERAEAARAAFAGKPEIFADYRQLLQRADIDVIINGTPDHWHTAVCIAACRAGKDVYTEKPLTLTIDEGKRLRQVVEETGRIVQVGTQQRSDKNFQTAVELVRNGRIGTLRQVWVALPFFSTKGGPFAAGPVPASLDWDMYQGQAPVHDYCVQRTHANFRWWYEYAGGIVTDWGNHHLDIAHWGMDCELTGPVAVEARGLFPNPQGPEYYNTPDRFFARLQYANGVEVFFFTSLNHRLRYGDVQDHDATTPEQQQWLFAPDAPEEVKTSQRDGITFVGDSGRIFVNRGGIYGKAAEDLPGNPLPPDAWRVRASEDHVGNFFAAVRTREEPVSPVRIQHRTATACHLTNISLRLGRKLAWDPQAEQIVGDDEANGWQQRDQRAPYQI